MPAFYRKALGTFLADAPEAVVGFLAKGLANEGFDISTPTMGSWIGQLAALHTAFSTLATANSGCASEWTVLLEYRFPVIGRRIDCVLLTHNLIIVIEYKRGTSTSGGAALTQAQNYAQDLRDFHADSRGRVIVPIAVGTFTSEKTLGRYALDGAIVAPERLASTIVDATSRWEPTAGERLDHTTWNDARYYPVPSVLEAATAAYQDQNVADIAKSRADAKNLGATQESIVEAVLDARATSKRVLIVVTGVPGAGKTLAGLRAVQSISSHLDPETEHASYLSGNAPLVKVLQEAIKQNITENIGRRRGLKSAIETRIREVHRFVRDTFASSEPPKARVIVFDEAQRAWDAARNKKKFELDIAEPEMVLAIMGRHEWAAVIALVGGGQEIGNGEAGLSAWGDALERHPTWHVVSSPEAVAGDAALAGSILLRDLKAFDRARLRTDPRLHLATAVRSFEHEATAEWVNAVLSNRPGEARALVAGRPFPISMTRDLAHARAWLSRSARGDRRCGLVASSGAERLRAEGIEAPTFDFLQAVGEYWRWFLAPRGDHRASYQLEVALSEFEMQGLELDYVGLLWGGDLLLSGDGAIARKFSGCDWSVREDLRARVINRYRVLMTRFRKAMTIFVPRGSVEDGTRPSTEFDAIADYLVACGVSTLDSSLPGDGREN